MEDIILKEMGKRQEELVQLREKVLQSLTDAPSGTLRAVKGSKSIQYYVKTPDMKGQYPKGKYVKKSEEKIAAQIAQRDYDTKVLHEIEKELAAITEFKEQYRPRQIEELFEESTAYRKKLIRPWIETDEQYIKNWLSVTYEGKGFAASVPEIYTEKGERVRSKSEKIIADKLCLKGIPYKYEYPLVLKGFGKIYPDFICLNVRKRKEIRWEHFGMMSQAEYCKSALKKMECYAKAGYTNGKEVIFSYESAEYPINTTTIDDMIDRYLR